MGYSFFFTFTNTQVSVFLSRGNGMDDENDSDDENDDMPLDKLKSSLNLVNEDDELSVSLSEKSSSPGQLASKKLKVKSGHDLKKIRYQAQTNCKKGMPSPDELQQVKSRKLPTQSAKNFY